MTPFLRPELRDGLRRWREALLGAGVLALGLWWALTAFGLLRALGVLLVGLGAAALAAGIQRGRFRAGGEGPGVVQVDEGQLAYFGPLSGGVISIATLVEVAFDPRAYPSPVWVLKATEGGPLHIPVDAVGAEALFDVFAALPGLPTERVLAARSRSQSAPVTLWRRPRAGVAAPRRGPRPTLH